MTSRDSQPAGASDAQRIDKWLWFARLTKTRTLAAEIVAAGKVRLNRARIEKPSHNVRVGDVLTVTLNRRVRVFKVIALGVRRGPSASARELYEELTVEADPLKPSAQTTPQFPVRHPSESGPGRRLPGSGRPTKKERRDIERLGVKAR